MLGYTTPNDASANAPFYFDDITRKKSTLNSTDELLLNKIYAYPNPELTCDFPQSIIRKERI